MVSLASERVGARARSWLSFLRLRLVCLVGLCLLCLEFPEKNGWGDSVGFGVIHGKWLENRVFDGTNRAPWGGMGRTWEKWG
jgi:hypothetical protein